MRRTMSRFRLKIMRSATSQCWIAMILHLNGEDMGEESSSPTWAMCTSMNQKYTTQIGPHSKYIWLSALHPKRLDTLTISWAQDPAAYVHFPTSQASGLGAGVLWPAESHTLQPPPSAIPRFPLPSDCRSSGISQDSILYLPL